MHIGDKKKFDFSKKEYTIVDIIEDANLPLSWDWHRGKCPHCGKDIVDTKEYTIGMVRVLENEDGIVYVGFTKELVEGHPLNMRLPDSVFYPEKDVTKQIKDKSKYLKEKK